MDRVSEPQASLESQNLTDRQVDGLLLSSKKIRYRNRKACYPCNKRKIKCDRDEQPDGQSCSNCRKRPHPELCSYEDSNPRSSGGSTRSVAHYSQPGTPNQHALQQAGSPVQGQPILSGIQAASTAYSSDRLVPQERDHVASYSPYYGDNSASYASTPYSANASTSPFAGQGLTPHVNHHPLRSDVNLPARVAPPVFAQAAPSAAPTGYALQRSANLKDEVSFLLPPQKRILPFFGVYRMCASLNPVILDLDDFEANVCSQVAALANGQLLDRIVSSRGQSQELALTQLALLLATMASGVQYSDVAIEERSQILREYTRNSLHCLRLANFILRPSFISIQTLLLLATVLQNDLEPEAAWASLNTTRALAQALGLETDRLSVTNGSSGIDPGHDIQSAIVWQESYLAICFGRRPTGLLPESAPPPARPSENLDYNQCLLVLSEAIAASYTHAPKQNDTLPGFASLEQRTLPRLQSLDHCRSIQNRIEYFAFRIQSSFVSVSLHLRYARLNNEHTQSQSAEIAGCRVSCFQTLKAFLDMQTFTVIPLRTWTFLHNALTSAILLGILDDQEDADVKNLQRSLFDTLMRSQEEGATPQNFRKGFGRALDKLQKMLSNSHQFKREGAQGRQGDTEMSDGAGPGYTGIPSADLIPDLATIWREYFADIAPADSNASIELPQQSTWGL